MNGLYTDAGWETGAGAHFVSRCPATGETVWEGCAINAVQAQAAVASARRAFPNWARKCPEERVSIVRNYAAALDRRKDEVAEAISKDMGKALWESQAEVSAMVNKVSISINAMHERAGYHVEPTGFGSMRLSHRAHGVMIVIGPYNFPGHLPNGHIVPALLAGNTCVFKPSKQAPSVAPLMVRCFEEAGLPAGCLNIVQGGREIVNTLFSEPIDGVLFTGSLAAGLHFHKHFAGRPDIILALEMGGNNPLIILDDVSAEAAADIAFQSGFLTTGQRCSCARRLLLPTGPFGDEVIDRLHALSAAVKVGPWNEPGIFMGPLVTEVAACDAVDFERMLEQRGGKVIAPLSRNTKSRAFLRPGLIDVTDADEVPDEELFGPLLQLRRFQTFDEALSMAADTRFGLAGGIVTNDEKKWEEARDTLRIGVFNWNRPTAGASSMQPFGGPGLSGNHRPSAYYAADYSAWPMASQIAEIARPMKEQGMI